ncbi:MAG TPA: hypothetical protein ENJ18_12580 [Nannocystis exedens]|nr:hypothetical protein [Nannocystis exedens]
MSTKKKEERRKEPVPAKLGGLIAFVSTKRKEPVQLALGIRICVEKEEKRREEKRREEKRKEKKRKEKKRKKPAPARLGGLIAFGLQLS